MFTKGGKPDLVLFLAVITLVSLGLIMVFSASSVMGLADAGNPYYYVQRQPGDHQPPDGHRAA